MGSENGRRRVVVTGMGAVTPLGMNAEDSWSNLIAGESGAGPITLFDPADFPTPLRLRAEGLRTRGLGRQEGGAHAWTASRRW